MKAEICCFVAACVLLLMPRPAAGQDKNAEDEMTKKWLAAGTPGPAHAALNDLVGSWDIATTTWMGGPGSKPIQSIGAAEVQWVLGGRFQRQEMKGEMNGMPMEGVGYTGYDNLNKIYIGVWIDNSSTSMYLMKGTFDSKGRVLTVFGTMDDAITGEYGKMVKYVTRIISKDKSVFEMYDCTIPGPDQRIAEMVYTRKK
jgi:hypothetical protein